MLALDRFIISVIKYYTGILMEVFSTFSSNVKEILLNLEAQDALERKQGKERSARLRQIPRETGELLFHFVSLAALSKNDPIFLLEIGTSGGYSTIWQALALKRFAKQHSSITTIEIDEKKVYLAKKNFISCNLDSIIKIIHADAKKILKEANKSGQKYSVFFIDAEKEDYFEYYQLIKKLALSPAIIIADNVISHEQDMKEFLQALKVDSEVIASIIPVGKGLGIIQLNTAIE
jgi:predicted O-methyltransferase YrrM